LIFSGSTVVDVNNTSGLGKNGKGPLVAMFTYHNMALEKSGSDAFQYQGIAYSNDQGKTWNKYAGNPVIPTPKGARDFRDPKVFWHAASKQWIVTLAVKDHVEFWSAPDLIHWKLLNKFGSDFGAHGGVWECPDLFPLPVRGSKKQKWVLLASINPGAPNGGSATQYFVGDFDGKNFKLDPAFATQLGREKALWVDWGRDNYAGVTWSNFTGSKGERLFMGWMSNWDYAQVVPTGSWRSAMTLPRSLSLKKVGTDWRLVGVPGPTVQMRDKQYLSVGTTILDKPLNLNPLTGIRPDAMELELEFDLPADASCKVGLELSNSKGERYRIGYDVGTKQFFSDRTKAGKNDFAKNFAPKVSTGPRFVKDHIVKMHLYLDVASCELFADSGLFQMTEIYFPTENFSNAQIFSEGGVATLRKAVAHGIGK
jgi:fructan beta-fructosidase